jgi:hypothetical protein
VNKLLITGFLIFNSLNCFSTCIAIYVAENGNIYVAADSRRTFFFDDANGQKFETVCKIHNVGTNYFAVSGIDDSGLAKEATKALQRNTNVYIAVKSFGNAMVKRYKQLMDDAKLFYPDKFPKFLKDGLASVSFFGYYCGLPNVYNIDFLCSLDKNGEVVIKYRINRVFVVSVIGISKDIPNAQPGDLPPVSIIDQNPELYVEALVKIEAKMHPLSVSEPIDLLELKPDGATWIRKNESAASY